MPTATALSQLFSRREGAQYWVRRPNGETSIECVGLASRVPEQAATPHTTWHCFSTTKPVTAVAVLQLALAGHCSLDAPLADYLPELPCRNGATIRQVLSHQAGFPNPLPLTWVHADARHGEFDAGEFLERVLLAHPRCKPAGLRSAYSNIGFLLLGRLIESVTGRAYEAHIREHVLDAVGCNAGGGDAYLDFAIPDGRHATGYTRRWSALGLFIALLPDGEQLRSSEGGWIRYRPFHLNGAAYGGLKGNVQGWAPLLTALATRDPRLLPPEGYDLLFTEHALGSGKPSGHAASFFVGQCAGHAHRCHAGGGPGYAAEIRVYPALQAASALLCNTTIVHDARLLDRLDTHWLP